VEYLGDESGLRTNVCEKGPFFVGIWGFGFRFRGVEVGVYGGVIFVVV
jgi:hypothetical protein